MFLYSISVGLCFGLFCELDQSLSGLGVRICGRRRIAPLQVMLDELGGQWRNIRALPV